MQLAELKHKLDLLESEVKSLEKDVIDHADDVKKKQARLSEIEATYRKDIDLINSELMALLSGEPSEEMKKSQTRLEAIDLDIVDFNKEISKLTSDQTNLEAKKKVFDSQPSIPTDKIAEYNAINSNLATTVSKKEELNKKVSALEIEKVLLAPKIAEADILLKPKNKDLQIQVIEKQKLIRTETYNLDFGTQVAAVKNAQAELEKAQKSLEAKSTAINETKNAITNDDETTKAYGPFYSPVRATTWPGDARRDKIFIGERHLLDLDSSNNLEILHNLTSKTERNFPIVKGLDFKQLQEKVEQRAIERKLLKDNLYIPSPIKPEHIDQAKLQRFKDAHPQTHQAFRDEYLSKTENKLSGEALVNLKIAEKNHSVLRSTRSLIEEHEKNNPRGFFKKLLNQTTLGPELVADFVSLDLKTSKMTNYLAELGKFGAAQRKSYEDDNARSVFNPLKKGNTIARVGYAIPAVAAFSHFIGASGAVALLANSTGAAVLGAAAVIITTGYVISDFSSKDKKSIGKGIATGVTSSVGLLGGGWLGSVVGLAFARKPIPSTVVSIIGAGFFACLPSPVKNWVIENGTDLVKMSKQTVETVVKQGLNEQDQAFKYQNAPELETYKPTRQGNQPESSYPQSATPSNNLFRRKTESATPPQQQQSSEPSTNQMFRRKTSQVETVKTNELLASNKIGPKDNWLAKVANKESFKYNSNNNEKTIEGAVSENILKRAQETTSNVTAGKA